MTLRYDYNLPWRAVIIGTLFYGGLSVFMLHLAKNASSVLFVAFIALSAMFAFLAIIMGTRRIVSPRKLELTEDAIFFPRGFARTRIMRIAYTEIIRMEDNSRASNGSISMFTSRGNFEIGAVCLPNVESYRAIRDFICSQASIVMGPHDLSRSGWRPEGFPQPIVHWVESKDWPRYRTSLVVAEPLLPRLAKTAWFFARCFGFIILPWLLLHLFQLDTIPAAAFLCLSIPITSFFTWLHWLNVTHPARCNEISFRERGISLFSGKQFGDLSYQSLSGWTVVERQFEGSMLHLLLLRGRTRILALALPDFNTRERVEKLLQGKKVPPLPDLKPPWEARE
ncbi:MAG TPA: hypothetical protein VNL17_00120 [Verrucomicrobiae bacterium]|nr:hypothetical protein [Verrucomicrobiae bacterium]